ncbi:RNA polymerase sigma factor [Pseudonocardia lacus]|uniref:RNA polymerase sigma factor n=1 Tax=Pseudonocardia lacus TaxID=2835865 RepID=UPI001BDC4F76|nr:sigma-70 family RNA polymerase sigma factor [Pseudonocardia lacus]
MPESPSTTAPSTAPATARTAPGERTVTDLVAAAAAGDRAAWTEIMARYGSMVRAVAGGFRLQEADAADAVQNTWLRALERLHTVRDPERLGGWLKTTARRECLSLLAAAGRERVDDEVGETLVESGPGPEALVLHDEMRRAVREAVDTLSGRRRTLVDVLFFGWPGNYAAASRMIGMPVGSIGPTRARTLRDLRARLEVLGVSDAGGGCGAAGWELPVATLRPGLPIGRAGDQPAGAGAGSMNRPSCVRDLMPSFR